MTQETDRKVQDIILSAAQREEISLRLKTLWRQRTALRNEIGKLIRDCKRVEEIYAYEHEFARRFDAVDFYRNPTPRDEPFDGSFYVVTSDSADLTSDESAGFTPRTEVSEVAPASFDNPAAASVK